MTLSKVDQRRASMPHECRKTYDKAMSGKGRSHAIKAHCAMCVGWQPGFKDAIRRCSDPACPLFPYRPYAS